MSITANIGLKGRRRILCTVLFTNFCLISFFLPSFSIFAEMPSMSMPTISSPSMPTLSTSSTSDSTSKNSTSSSSSSSSQSSTSSTSSAISNAAATSAALQNLTASDISSLTGTSSLSALGSLLGLSDSTTSSSLSSVSSITTSTATNTLLQQILQQLSILVEKQQSTTNTSATGTSSAGTVSNTATVSSTNTDISLPQLLRLRANGYNLLDTCTTLYFSKPEKNGTFLLTGDRKYLSGNAYRKETFYFLFVPLSTSDTQQTKYEVATTIIQDQVNEYSYLYQAATHSPLTASKTGNLITLYISDKSYTFEILIQLGDTQ